MPQLDRFQEWPQLLDPVLALLVQDIVDGYLAFITHCPEAYLRPSPAVPSAVPLTHALSSLLYMLCKVRGHKIIIRLLNNEPRFIEPMLSAVKLWQSPSLDERVFKLSWEDKYILYLWLSHLMLAPFELSTISTPDDLDVAQNLDHLTQGLPQLAQDVLLTAFASITSPSKERESAILLLIRLALRKDMQLLKLPHKLASNSIKSVLATENPTQTIYDALGHLSLLYALINLGSDSEVAPFITAVHDASTTLVTSNNPRHAAIRDAAPVRKMLIKIMRACMTHAMKLSESSNSLNPDSVNSMLEDSIQYYLDALGDNDSPVRMAASKALSIVALRLDASMSAEIIEAVLACLSENVLVEDPQTGRIMAKIDFPADEGRQMKRNVSAADPLKWHGLMLTLGHLLFRRSPPAHQLPAILEALLLGLEFEQRSNLGTSIGVGVRDGACFGIWALARKYSTQELNAINTTETAGALADTHTKQSILQTIATRLVLSSCLDPSGNIRRGSSAALQELIGRHPDTIIEGIPVVQVVDYLAVARRSRAVTEVAVQVAALDACYHDALLDALVDWRGARAADAGSRRWAAIAVRELYASTSAARRAIMLRKVIADLTALKSRNLGVTAATRHGLLLCAGALLRSIADSDSTPSDAVSAILQELDIIALSGSIDGRATTDLELVMEGLGKFIDALARIIAQTKPTQHDYHPLFDQSWIILNRSLLASEKDNVVQSCTEAASRLFSLLSETQKRERVLAWLDAEKQKPSEMLCRGRLSMLASLHPQLSFDAELQHRVERSIVDAVQGKHSIELKVNAMQSLCVLMQMSPFRCMDIQSSLCDALIAGLSDYTNDQRGDIGSLLRSQTIEAVDAYRTLIPQNQQASALEDSLLPHIVRLAIEKLSKVRHRAWRCLVESWGSAIGDTTLTGNFSHLVDVSSEAYFIQLIPLLRVEGLQTQVLRGLSSSIGGGTEDICRACSAALVSWLLSMEPEEQEQATHALTVSLIEYLGSLHNQDDRDVVPTVELTTFLLEQSLLSDQVLAGTHNGKTGIWNSIQQLHTQNIGIERLSAMIRLYSALVRASVLQNPALDKLTRQLLHRYPKIRNAAADALYPMFPSEQLLASDWSAAATSNKAVVLELRREMKVVPATKG